MAYETNVGQDFTFPSDIDLSGSQFYFVVMGSDGYLDIAGAGVLALGTIQDGPVGTATSIRGTSVRTAGITKVVCGGSFNPGDKVASDSAGKCVKYTGATVFTGTPYTVSGSQVLGIALEAGSSGQNSTILLSPSGLAA
jgi:hypothetical protein